MNPVRVGVIGCGYWGPNLVRNFFKLQDCEVVAVADLDPMRLQQIQRLYPKLETTTGAVGLINRSDIDAVAVVTPVSTHYELAHAALRAGKHVLVSKSMTATSAQAEELIALAERQQRILMVDHTFIYGGPVRKIRELIDQGELGQIYYYDSVRVNLGLFQRDVNVLWDLAPHDLSIMTYLIGKEPVSVSALGARPVNSGNYQHKSVAYVTIRFADETLAHVHVSWLSPVKIRRTLIGGSRKMVVYDHLDPDNQVKVYDKGVEVRSPEEQHQALVQYRLGDMYAPKVDQTEALEIECQHFVDCGLGQAKPITDGYSGLKVVRLLEAAQQSMERDGEVIHLGLGGVPTHSARC
jgi:predicted dehydrogenase